MATGFTQNSLQSYTSRFKVTFRFGVDKKTLFFETIDFLITLLTLMPRDTDFELRRNFVFLGRQAE